MYNIFEDETSFDIINRFNKLDEILSYSENNKCPLCNSLSIEKIYKFIDNDTILIKSNCKTCDNIFIIFILKEGNKYFIDYR